LLKMQGNPRLKYFIKNSLKELVFDNGSLSDLSSFDLYNRLLYEDLLKRLGLGGLSRYLL
jgi:hypothetical protein